MMRRVLLAAVFAVGFASVASAAHIRNLVVEEDSEGYRVVVGERLSFRDMEPYRIYAFYSSNDEASFQYRIAIPLDADLPGLDQILEEVESDERPVYSNRHAILPPLDAAIHSVIPGQYFDARGIDEDISWTSFRLTRGDDLEWLSTPMEERPHFRAKVGRIFGHVDWSMERNLWALNEAQTNIQIEIYVGVYTYIWRGRKYRLVNRPDQTIINVFLDIDHWRF